MKKIISFLMAIAIVLSFAVPAFATEAENTVEVEWIECQMEEPWDDGIMPCATLALDFADLAPDACVTGSDVYYINNASTILKVVAASWNSQDEDIGIGWYNMSSGIIYYSRFTGGSIVNKKINSSALPVGNYKVVIINLGELDITGSMQYTVS